MVLENEVVLVVIYYSCEVLKLLFFFIRMSCNELLKNCFVERILRKLVQCMFGFVEINGFFVNGIWVKWQLVRCCCFYFLLYIGDFFWF